MKYISFFIIFFVCQYSVMAQKASLKKANKLYDNRAYVEAARMFQQLKQTPEVLEKLGDCYYYNSDFKKARTPYTNLFVEHRDTIPEEAIFKYAHTLKGLNDYEQADIAMGAYLGYPVDTKNFIENLNKLVPFNYEIKRMTRSSGTGDFGISYYGDKVVFSSLRNSENPSYSWNEKPYLDLFKASISKDTLLVQIEPLSEEINSKTHESNAIFTKDGKTMYFCRTNNKRVDIDGQKVATVSIYKATFEEGKWTNIEALPFTSELYSTEHPALTRDEDRLYFSSDMPGSMGSFDIFYVDILEDGFGVPVNLGDAINTIHREQFPFIDEESNLFFASDGHEGLGGLDVFSSFFYDDFYSKPLNLGETLNSGYDDFGYVLNNDGITGFIASNRERADNLYAFKRTENGRRFLVEGDIRDKHSKELLPGATVTLFDEDGNMVAQMVVGSDALYAFNTKPNSTYTIEAHKDLYIPSSQSFTTNAEGKIVFNIELEIESYDDAEDIVVTKDDGYVYIELENIYFDLNKWDIKPQAGKTLDILVALLNKYPRMEIQLGAHTDSRASDLYNLWLSNKRAASALEYLVQNGIDRDRLRSKGFGERKPLIDCGNDCSETEHSINRRCEFLILR